MNWLDKLREECSRAPQVRVAERIGYSAAVVNQVLSGTYKGDLRAVQKAIEGAFMGATVACPVLGEIASDQCLREQKREYAATNPGRVRLWKACRGECPHSRVGKEAQP